MIYTITITPYRVAFIDEDSIEWYSIDLAIDFTFLVDVLVNCVSAYYKEDDVLIVNKKAIFMNYLRT
jgi:hypothetical protein